MAKKPLLGSATTARWPWCVTTTLVRPVVDSPEVSCKPIVERHRRYVLGAHVVGEYSAEVIQMVAACTAGNMRIEQIAELQPAFPTFTEAAGMAAQQIVRQLGIASWAAAWVTSGRYDQDRPEDGRHPVVANSSRHDR